MYNHIFLITTYQYPHLEHMFMDISYLSSMGKKVLVINLINSKFFIRSDLQWKNFKRFFSLHFRNTKLSARVRFFLKKINECSIDYIEEIRSIENTKLDISFEKIISDTASNYLSNWENSYFIDNDRSKILKDILVSYFSKFYKNFSDIFKNNNNSLFHIFNGRFPIEYILKEKFLKSHKVLIYECNEFNHKCVRKMNTVHMLNGFSYETNILNQRINSALKINFVNELIKYKRKNKIIAKEKFDFIYYTTNLDEYSFTGHTLDQTKFIQKFCISFPKGSKVAIRLHPNTNNKNEFDKFYWKTFSEFIRSKGVRVFSFEENIDSYALSNSSTLSFSLGSSVGGELIFLDQNHYFIGNNTPFSSDKGVISLNPSQIELTGFPSKKVYKENKINKDLIASALMLPFFIGDNFEYNLFRNTKNELYHYMYSIFSELFNDPNLNLGIRQHDLLEI